MAKLTEAIGKWNRDELGAAFDAADVPAGPIKAVDEVLARPAHAARAAWSRASRTRQIGEFRACAVPLKFDGWDDPQVGRPPLLGEHTESVLAERLGYSRERIAALREAKAI